MKRVILALASILWILLSSPFIEAQELAKKQVAVYLTDSDVDEGYKKVISSKMVAKITQSANYRALERTDDFLKALRTAQDYDTSGEVKDSQIARIGQKLGVRYVAVVDCADLLGNLYVSARLIDVESGAIIATSEEYEGNLTLPNVIRLAEKVGAVLTSQGTSSSPSSSVGYSSQGGGSAQIETFNVNGVPFEMVRVEGGTFSMGSYSGESDEQPVHSETVGTFYIGKTEVTQRLWSAVMGSNPSNFRGENLPVENVSWFDCQEFVDRLSRLTGRIFRLPTEAEWEYAARGGNKSRNYTYSGSNDLYRVAWYTENSGSTTHPVGQKLDNELGIFDMSGNVWEWCSDNYSSSYSQPRNSSNRILRGGSWSNGASYCRVAYRNYSAPGGRSSNLGLRLAL